jgi:hypothetical protein
MSSVAIHEGHEVIRIELPGSVEIRAWKIVCERKVSQAKLTAAAVTKNKAYDLRLRARDFYATTNLADDLFLEVCSLFFEGGLLGGRAARCRSGRHGR